METKDLVGSVPEEQMSDNAQTNETTTKAVKKPLKKKSTISDEDALSVENAEAEVGKVDFSDEEVSLAASSQDYELGEESEEESQSASISAETLQNKNRPELLSILAELLEKEPIQTLRKSVEQIKIAFYKAYRADVDAARRKFLEEGGNIEEFVFDGDDGEVQLKDLFKKYRTLRDSYTRCSEEEKAAALNVKLGIIDELKELVAKGESDSKTFEAFRELQNRWKESGAVPKANVKDVWESYHLQVENFYNIVKINKELRDLDLKKNYEIKLALCEDAESLLLETSVVTAFHKLQKLHEQWRETGPVAVEYKDALWVRFREAGTRINRRHQEHFEAIKEEQRCNLELKVGLCERVEELVQRVSTSRKEWSGASVQLAEIQKLWKTIGFAPKKDNTKIYERFRNSCDLFFEKKRDYFATVKAEIENNYRIKLSYCTEAEGLADSSEWRQATAQILDLQKRWKAVGPTSRKQTETTWTRFRAACDKFFSRKSEFYGGLDGKYEENLVAKRALLEEIKSFNPIDAIDVVTTLKAYQRRWSEIGFVPMKDKDALQTEYRAVLDAHYEAMNVGAKERKIGKYRIYIEGHKNKIPNKNVVFNERDKMLSAIRMKESDILLWKNNIGFFAKSKNADALVQEISRKIERAEGEVALIKEKLKVLDETK